MADKLNYTYDMFIDDFEQFYKETDTDEFQQFDTILALSRGGLVLAQYLGYIYDIRNIISIPVIGYELEEDTGRRDILDVDEYKQLLKHRKVLIVDDIYDTGASINTVIETFNDVMDKYRTFVIFAPLNKTDYFILKHDGRWINFPWDLDVDRIKKAKE
jgi:hypoxanthine phosphoribosyltransferase